MASFKFELNLPTKQERYVKYVADLSSQLKYDTCYCVGDKGYMSEDEVVSKQLMDLWWGDIDKYRKQCTIKIIEYTFDGPIIYKKFNRNKFRNTLLRARNNDLYRSMIRSLVVNLVDNNSRELFNPMVHSMLKRFCRRNFNKIYDELMSLNQTYILKFLYDGRFNDHWLYPYIRKVYNISSVRRIRSYKQHRFDKINREQYHNRFSLLENLVDLSTDDEIEDDLSFIAIPSVPCKLRRDRDLEDHTRFVDFMQDRASFEPRVRDGRLLRILRNILALFRWHRTAHAIRGDIPLVVLDPVEYRHSDNDSVYQSCESIVDDYGVEPQMMEPQQVNQQQEAGPVVLTNLEEDVAKETTENVSDNFWIVNSTGDAVVNQRHASSMEILLHKFQWKSAQSSNYRIFDLKLPVKAISENPTHPAAMLFNQYAYWNGDIKLRIHINTTPFHIGKLIFSWYYAAEFDANVNHRNNIASSILLPHVCYNAADGNDVVLEIPFKNYRSMLCTRNDSDTDSQPLYLGNFRCHVFNPLRLTSDTVVDGYVHVSFINNSFTGISPRVPVQPEMMNVRSLVKTAEGVMRTVDSLANMDKPSNIVPPVMYMPQLTDSFATGLNDVNNVHMLRLDPTGQTPHPIGSSTRQSETLIKDIISKPGLLRLLNWGTNSARGYNLMRLPVSPELNYTDYYSVQLKNRNDVYAAAVLPPVSAISCINAYNRGSLVYTIEIVCSRYHAGAILVSFTPRATNVSLDVAIQSYNATLDIGNIKSYDFIVPYINERPYNPRFNRDNSNTILPQLAPIGEFNIFVLNELRSVNATSDGVYVNVYLKAGPDFEVAVPVPPLYSVNYDYKKPFNAGSVYLTQMSNETGLDTWRYFDSARKLVVFKYGTPADDVAQLVGAEPFVIYRVVPRNNNKLQDSPYLVSSWRFVNARWEKVSEFSFNAQYFAVIIVNGDKGSYRYIAPFYNLQVANSYVKAHKSLVTDDNPYPDSPSLEAWLAADPTNVNYYLCLSDNGSASYRHTTSSSPADFPFTTVANRFEAQMDNVIVDPTLRSLPSVMDGMRLYGEQFKDLKDYGRRYQIYGSASVSTTSTTHGFRIRVPITPIGLDLTSDKNGLLHYVLREGMIGYIASAYRFYRGSLRFKIVCTKTKGKNDVSMNVFNTWYIQHKPDVLLNTRQIEVKNIEGLNPEVNDVLQSGYAYTAFSPHLNNSITFEIPCYIPTNLLMLQKPNFTALAETLHYTLGCFDILGFTDKDVEQYEFVIHYSLADDMNLSCFVGFPPMVPLYSLAKIKTPVTRQISFELVNSIQPEGQDVIISDTEKASTSNTVLNNTATTPIVTEGGLVSTLKEKATRSTFNYALSNVRESFNLEPVQDDSVWQLIKDATSKYTREYADVIISIVFQVIQCIVNPEISTFVIAFVAVLAHFGFKATDYICDLGKWFRKFFSVEAQSAADDDKTEKSSIVCVMRTITDAIVSMGAALFDKPASFIKNLKVPDFSSKLFVNVKNGALTLNAVMTLFKNLATVVPKIVSFLGKAINPLQWYKWLFSSKRDFIKSWISDCEWMTDPNNIETIKSNMKYAVHAELLVIVGRDISLKVGQLSKEESSVRYIHDLNSKLNNVYQSIVSNFKSISGIGIEPYSFRLVGDSQCGKSYIIRSLACECLRSIDYKSYGNLVYTRPKTKHFDGLTGVEPIIYYDDFLHIKTPEALSESIGELLTLKSKCVFTPPRADVNDKGKPFNPLILCATMNEMYPVFKDVTADPHAWQNRFDDTVHVTFCPPEPHKNCTMAQELPQSVLENFDHVRFKIMKYRNNSPSNPNADTEYKKVQVPEVPNNANDDQIASAKSVSVTDLNYTQLKWYISKQFQACAARISYECAKDYATFEKFRPQSDTDFEVNLEGYTAFIQERNKVLNDQEKETMDVVRRIIKKDSCSKCKNPVISCLCKLVNPAVLGTLSVQAEDPEPEDVVLNALKFSKFSDTIQHTLNLVKKRLDGEYVNFDIISSYIHSHRHNRAYSDEFIDLVKSPCVHRYVNFMRSSHSCSLDYDVTDPNNKKLVLVLNYKDYDLECEKCQLLSMDSNYKKFLYGLFKFYFNGEPVPDILKIVNKKVDVAIGRYAERMKKLKAQFERFLDTDVDMESWMSRNGSMCYTVCKSILSVLAVVGVVYGITNFKSLVSSGKKAFSRQEAANKLYAKTLEEHTVTEDCHKGKCYVCVKPQMAYDDVAIKRPRKHMQPKDIVVPSVQGEMAVDMWAALDKKLRKNYFYIVAEYDGLYYSVRCIGLRDKWFIAIDHYFDHFVTLPDTTQFTYCNRQSNVPIRIKDIQFSKITNSALIIGCLPKQFPAFKNIISLFAPESVVANCSPQMLLYEVRSPDKDKLIGDYDLSIHRNTATFHTDVLPIPDINNIPDKYTYSEYYWRYQTSGKGLCGSVLISDMNITSPIVGIHVAGQPGGGAGYAEAICRETIVNALEKLEPKPIIIDRQTECQMFDGKPINLIDDPKFVKSALDGDYEFMGVVPSKFAYRPPIKSKLMHTLCYNQITTSTYDYPHLYHRDERFEGSPMVNGCQHHVEPPLTFEPELLDVVHDDIRNRVLSKVKPLRPNVGVLSVAEAVVGIPQIPNYAAMEMDTSEGFPFSSVRPDKAKDKRWLFDMEETIYGYNLKSVHPLLIQTMRDKQDAREQGIVPLTIFTDCLKDAKLPLEKCHKTRIFSISPVDFTIQFRQYFYDFTIAFQEARFGIESAVGINVDSYEWHDMVQSLVENSPQFVCGDYSKFGPRLMASTVIRFFEIICDWYEENGDRDQINRRVRMIMAHEVAFACHLMLNMVYMVMCGAPSGCPITTILNNGVNMFYLRVAYLALIRSNKLSIKNKILTLQTFYDYVKVYFYGDDLIMTVKQEIIDFFNAQYLTEFFAKYGIKFTDALKTGTSKLYTSVYAPETSFLKRNVKRHERRPVYTAAMDKRAIEETCNWTFACADLVEASIISCESMLLNAHGHGSQYYEALRFKVMKWWRSYGECPRIPSWHDVDWRIYEGIQIGTN